MMELRIESTPITEVSADLLVINLFEGATEVGGATGLVNAAIGNLVAQQIEEHDFEGKELDCLAITAPTSLSVKQVLLIGLGKPGNFTAVTARKVAAKSIKKARELRAKKIATVIHGTDLKHLDPIVTSQMLAEGLLLGNYQFNRYKTVDRDKVDKYQIEEVIILVDDPANLTAVQKGIAKGEAIASAILNARDIINEPPSKIKPASIAQAAEEISELSKDMSVTVLDEAKLKQEGYNTLLAVAAGSEEKPYLIHLHYKPANAKRSVAFVGKGVTFDSGGLGIKPWSAMLTMKTDMAGAANVLGIFQALAELEAIGQPIPLEVHGVIATTENMISGKAMRPDDIIETKSGKTIEIIHTDAEGRLILSDALSYVVDQKPDYIVDYATLTGAAIRALGRDYAVYMGNSDELMDLVKKASEQTGELAWPLPLPDIYKKYIESPVADLQNASTSDYAPGAIIAGLFLQEFVDNRPWVHLDIAGPSWQDEDKDPLTAKGATGYGILLGLALLELIQ